MSEHQGHTRAMKAGFPAESIGSDVKRKTGKHAADRE